MSNYGERLKAYRNKLGYSLKKAGEKVDITDSRLSRMEHSEMENPPARDLKKLATLYNVPVIDFYIDVGYLEDTDLSEYQQVFSGVSTLNNEEKKYIQGLIDLLNRKKVQS